MEHSKYQGRDSEESVDYSRRSFFGFAASGLAAAALSGCTLPLTKIKIEPRDLSKCVQKEGVVVPDYCTKYGNMGQDEGYDNGNGSGDEHSSGNSSGGPGANGNGPGFGAGHNGGDGVGAR